MFEHLREETLNSEIAFQGRLLTVRVDTVRMPDGTVSTREIVVHPGAVAMVPVLDADHVLLVRQWRAAAGRALLEIPAGTLSPGEEPTACAQRELMEEVGYRPRSLTPLYTTYLAPGYSSEQLHVYLAEDLVPEFRDHDEDEALDVVSLTWSELEDLLFTGQIADSKTLAGVLLAQKMLQGR
ncbi:MAG: NUDIX domain-containing protein [Armatimonadota bacterium]